MATSDMSPRRPYLLRAFYEWLIDNQLTPHLVVDVTRPGVSVPMEFARDGQIVLNVAPRAVANLELGNEGVSFNARFGGIPCQVTVPMGAVMAIYARENGSGTMFEPEEAYDSDADGNFVGMEDDETTPTENLMLVTDDTQAPQGEGNSPDDEPPQPPRSGGRPALRVVK
ncbi:TPA: ClpXP protease specificity-enhancing factor [Yersinia enterocolitica]|uniref:ClpXP protease specificity-enhancing factor n=1 Tax=Yersinia enterocolitica TaxID=630 RepID=UPI001CA58125|nr:ClpXP protease specificity-enhancing factor [Yersinia enterocolitica]MBW5834721.1 ClpXP protease specificity-enhancing factor [Yersinia enterocolitica]HEN3603232.1 ClpXP protease specificity-enhancing factor [Yersinia enterocolitica]HEN3623658.1 ClpXP protease specificity-enhancing factor [Yersinia enterocolitica]HEN3635537.1 ClpXP protease specificity-enhancing factor [Yersinia enterocolitica]HEN3656376.1 ClpXP protease specificity-enhancing factor [Yersinia enterocolitica]